MGLHLRKRVAQVGVLLLIASYLAPYLVFPLFYVAGVYDFTVLIPLIALAIPVLVLAALIPDNPDEKWGSMWPLVGYDNVIDAIYTRGTWWQRFYELDEQDAERRVTTAMGEWF